MFCFVLFCCCCFCCFYLLFLICLFAYFLWHHCFLGGTTNVLAVGREGDLLNINCTTNITSIISASFHRISKCDNCTNRNVSSDIRDLCIGYRSCSIPVSRNVFGDHCAGNSILYLAYYCQGKRLIKVFEGYFYNKCEIY